MPIGIQYSDSYALGKMWKEAVVAYLKAAHQNLAEGIEEKEN
jgi:hypothetical protein